MVATAMLRALKAADGPTVGVKGAVGALAGESLDRVVAAGDAVSVSVLANALRGDVNGNSRVNIVDAQIVYDMATGCYGEGYAAMLLPDGWTYATLLWAANVNADEANDAADAFAIQHFVHSGTWG